MNAEQAEKRRTALIIDDNSVSRMIIEDELESVGVAAISASVAKDGLAMARENPPSIIIIDPYIGGFDGVKLISDLKVMEITRDIPVVVVTGVDLGVHKENGLKSNTVKILPKPFSAGTLAEFITRTFEAEKSLKSFRILLVEDSSTIRAVTKYLLEKNGHSVIEAVDGVQGFEALKARHAEIDMIITDINMPNMDGRRLVELIRDDRKYQFIPIVVATTISEKENIKLLLNMGADDYIIKPFSSEEFVARIQSHLRVKNLYGELQTATEKLAKFNEVLERRVRERTADLREANLDAIFSLATAAEAKDESTGNHVIRIQNFSATLAEKLGLPASVVEEIGYSSIMHDVGKISVPDDILKKPGALTSDEFDIMKTHTTHGERILPKKPFFEMARIIARSHHEKWNGKGYPDRLAGEDIPLPARIVAVSDVFDALTNARPYKQAWPVEKANEELVKGSGSQFDPDLIEAWMELFREGRISVIMKQWR
ncbi:MAG: response regulator [Nitrospinae bacterium]|nr:response regulator [Nitrospinota bacterium]